MYIQELLCSFWFAQPLMSYHLPPLGGQEQRKHLDGAVEIVDILHERTATQHAESLENHQRVVAKQHEISSRVPIEERKRKPQRRRVEKVVRTGLEFEPEESDPSKTIKYSLRLASRYGLIDL